METLLVVAVVLISLAIIVQAGVLVAMYLMGRSLADNVNDLMNDSRKLIPPLECAANNLKAASDDLLNAEKTARRALMRPVRQCSAIAAGVAKGLRTLFHRKPRPESESEREHPAA
ncbi:MAG TPA: hypothetical protein VE422_10155 [Terriglobia bacterium]|nr:hypothetical protein [Terriglobia bacterium]